VCQLDTCARRNQAELPRAGSSLLASTVVELRKSSAQPTCIGRIERGVAENSACEASLPLGGVARTSIRSEQVANPNATFAVIQYACSQCASQIAL
jgi:hypothetical protein